MKVCNKNHDIDDAAVTSFGKVRERNLREMNNEDTAIEFYHERRANC
jgi:hypothetical protein